MGIDTVPLLRDDGVLPFGQAHRAVRPAERHVTGQHQQRRLTRVVVVGQFAAGFQGEQHLTQHLPRAALLWLTVGGVLYTTGAVGYATKWPRTPRGGWGFHELWHLFVLGGSAAHVVMMFNLR